MSVPNGVLTGAELDTRYNAGLKGANGYAMGNTDPTQVMGRAPAFAVGLGSSGPQTPAPQGPGAPKPV